MKTIEYRDTMDKSKWPRGEWDNEPDKIQWLDEATGLPCLIVRNHAGAWCGYVGVSEGHPFFGKHYSGEFVAEKEVDGHKYTERDYANSPSSAVSIHGGLTFSDFCDTGAKECEGICHVVEPGENDKVWWLGFDCGHAFDFMPALQQYTGIQERFRDVVYRNVVYVQDQCHDLAKQLAAIK